MTVTLFKLLLMIGESLFYLAISTSFGLLAWASGLEVLTKIRKGDFIEIVLWLIGFCFFTGIWSRFLGLFLQVWGI